jgi:hypothetical protein
MGSSIASPPSSARSDTAPLAIGDLLNGSAQEIGEPLFDVIYVKGRDFHLRTKPPLTHSTRRPCGKQGACKYPIRLQIVRQQTLGVPPASTVCIHVRSMFCPVRMTAARRPCSRPRSLDSAASAAAPAPSAQLWVAL